MKFEFYETLEDEVIDSLWKQNVNMDDWDYMLFFPEKYKAEFPVGFDDINLEPRSYNVDRLLNGCCSNKWYPVKDFMGKQGILGVAYHA